MQRPSWPRRTLSSALIGLLLLPQGAAAAPLVLAQYPAGSAYRLPAPNVIVTLDDSGSMAYYRNDTTMLEQHANSRMTSLKRTLREVFGEASGVIPDGSIRLAWNTFNQCESIPSGDLGCRNRNRMRTLTPAHRAAFLDWVGLPQTPFNLAHLTASGSTPMHRAMLEAGEYLRLGATTHAESPWAYDPGVRGAPFLSCRRSYNVVMSDGSWNFSFITHGRRSAVAGLGPNVDGTSVTLPDGTLYDAQGPHTRLYSDRWGEALVDGLNMTNVSTIADLAFAFWSRDLAPGLPDNLRPQIRHAGPEVFQTASGSVELPEYWNPRNNPATWQHMITYAIGYGDAAEWSTPAGHDPYPVWDAVTNDTFGGSLPALIRGEIEWPNPIRGSTVLDPARNGEARKTEMWHMALNGRGKFVPARSADDLARAFREIMAEIITDNSMPVTSFSSASSTIARADTSQFRAGYRADQWTGYVAADTLAAGTGVARPHAGWGTRPGDASAHMTTADKLDALSDAQIADRLVLTWRDDLGDAGGTLFEWPSTSATPAQRRDISAAQKQLLTRAGEQASVGQRRLQFLRGVRADEDGLFRARGSRQGDIVNSQLWYLAAPASNYALPGYLAFTRRHRDRLPMVYVGGNDGMLHGFSALDGSEQLAYVPKGVIGELYRLTQRDYPQYHRYFVDGSPFSGDVNWGDDAKPDWRTLLVGTLGAGGRGYFVLDVTNPGTTATDGSGQNSQFRKANAGSLVVLDRTAPSSADPGADSVDADIGHIMVDPVLDEANARKSAQIVRMNNGRWALVMGNGYNSKNKRPVLLVQFLDQTRELLRLVAASSGAEATDNGLSAPRLVDINGDGTPDVVYAGDLRGNIWKFDLSSATASNWKVAFQGSPLFTAQYQAAGQAAVRQPVTAPPLVRANDRGVGGLMVAFGTGRNLSLEDRTDGAQQTFYSVLDNTRYRVVAGKLSVDTSVPAEPVGAGVQKLVEQSVRATPIQGQGESAQRVFYTVSSHEVAYAGDGARKGWYMHLPMRGERVLAQLSMYDDSNIIEVMSVVPATGGGDVVESCEPPPNTRRDFRTLINIMDGRPPSVPLLDTNGDGLYTAADQGASRMTASAAEGRVRSDKHQLRLGTGGADGDKQITDKLRLMPEIALRPNWRQLQ